MPSVQQPSCRRERGEEPPSRSSCALGWPIWTRLLAFALVPLGGMALIATPVRRERAAVVDASRRTDRDVAALNVVLELRPCSGSTWPAG